MTRTPCETEKLRVCNTFERSCRWTTSFALHFSWHWTIINAWSSKRELGTLNLRVLLLFALSQQPGDVFISPFRNVWGTQGLLCRLETTFCLSCSFRWKGVCQLWYCYKKLTRQKLTPWASIQSSHAEQVETILFLSRTVQWLMSLRKEWIMDTNTINMFGVPFKISPDVISPSALIAGSAKGTHRWEVLELPGCTQAYFRQNGHFPQRATRKALPCWMEQPFQAQSSDSEILLTPVGK